MSYKSNGMSRIKGLACLIVAAVFCSQAALFAQNFTFTSNTYSTGGDDGFDLFPVYLNSDGLPDLIIADQDFYACGLTNNGYGAFSFDENLTPYGSLNFVGAPIPNGAIAAYVNGPGASNLDLIVLDQGGSFFPYGHEMDIWANDGTGLVGSFNGSYPNYIVEGGSGLLSITAANISHPNKPDLIASYDNTDLALYTNNDQGSFNFYATFPVGSQPYHLIAADLNSNGMMDVVSANYGDNTLTVTPIIGGQPPSIGSSFTLTVGSGPNRVVATDLRGSGRLDLVSANAGSGTLTIYTNNGSGGFGSNATLNAGGANSVTAVDLNGDGKPDLVCANGSGLTIFVNNGSGVFTSNVTLNVSGAGGVFSADVNGDGKPDLVCLSGRGSVAVLINTTVPWLNIADANDQIALNWPNWATNYFLEFTTNVNTPNWTMVANAVPPAGHVTLTNSWPAAFFRLHEN